MKKFLLLIICCGTINTLFAQDNILVYGEIGGGIGNYRSIKGGIDIGFEGDNLLTPCFYFNGRRSPDVPSDYHPGFLSGYPQQEFEMFGLMYGKIVPTDNPNVRVALRAGILLGDYETPYDFNDGNGGLLGPNYSYKYNHEFTGAVLLNPVLELPFARHFGFSFGLFSLLNDKSSSVGGEVNMIFGHVRNKHHELIEKK